MPNCPSPAAAPQQECCPIAPSSAQDGHYMFPKAIFSQKLEEELDGLDPEGFSQKEE